ncbi:MAG: hypothetical protein SPE19_00085 [Candidatus Faecousia sp.]|nr:hypothetical protein [Bacillota bacterium]MDY4488918.1 hypothetical protein [Candidatus Faecousia sp.]MDY4754461.1 hypothetical protein [Candidatus Faecousia sp.]MDY6161087.1 hypothetical protein [Candidatus Faecousia sp.]
MLKNKTIGFYIAFFSGAAAVVASIAYLAIYMATAAETVDRVFSWFTFGFMLAGGLIATAGELTRMKWIPLASCACFSLALANHAVEFAYPLADVLTKVPFFGGNYPLALTFTIIFGVIALASVTAAFMKHE